MSSSSLRASPLLNLDVLAFLCTFLTNDRDLLSFSMTCSALRPAAVQHLLRSHSVVLRSPNSICKFHDFVFSDATARLPHIIALDIHLRINDPQLLTKGHIERLLAILSHASSLKSLGLYDYHRIRDPGCFDDPRIATAVGKLTALRNLTVVHCNKTDKIVAAVCAPLTSLTITRFFPEFDFLIPTSVSQLLSHLQWSLETLSLDSLRLNTNSLSSKFAPNHNLRSLFLHGLEGAPYLSVLLELFPRLSGTLSVLLDFVPNGVNRIAFPELRELNLKAQESRTWRGLQHLICDVSILYVLGLKCPIDLLSTHSRYSSSRPLLTESLRENPCQRLNLHVKTFGGLEVPQGLIPPETAAVLTHLTLCLVCVDSPEISGADFPILQLHALWVRSTQHGRYNSQ